MSIFYWDTLLCQCCFCFEIKVNSVLTFFSIQQANSNIITFYQHDDFPLFQFCAYGISCRFNWRLKTDAQSIIFSAECLNMTAMIFIFTQERVTILIEQLRNFGVDEKILFQPEDLLEKKNIPKVARCLSCCVDLVNNKTINN